MRSISHRIHFSEKVEIKEYESNKPFERAADEVVNDHSQDVSNNDVEKKSHSKIGSSSAAAQRHALSLGAQGLRAKLHHSLDSDLPGKTALSEKEVKKLYPNFAAYRGRLARDFKIPPRIKSLSEAEASRAAERANEALNKKYGTKNEIYVTGAMVLGDAFTEGLSKPLKRMDENISVKEFRESGIDMFGQLGDDNSGSPIYVNAYPEDIQDRISPVDTIDKLEQVGGYIESINWTLDPENNDNRIDLPSFGPLIKRRSLYIHSQNNETLTNLQDQAKTQAEKDKVRADADKYLVKTIVGSGNTIEITLEDALTIHATMLGVDAKAAYDALKARGLTQGKTITEEYSKNPRFLESVAYARSGRGAFLNALATADTTNYPEKSLYPGEIPGGHHQNVKIKAASILLYDGFKDNHIAKEYRKKQ